MEYEIVDTVVVDYETYIDLCVLSGIQYTQIYKKINEPNEFNMVHAIEGFDIEAAKQFLEKGESNEQ